MKAKFNEFPVLTNMIKQEELGEHTNYIFNYSKIEFELNEIINEFYGQLEICRMIIFEIKNPDIDSHLLNSLLSIEIKLKVLFERNEMSNPNRILGIIKDEKNLLLDVKNVLGDCKKIEDKYSVCINDLMIPWANTHINIVKMICLKFRKTNLN